MPSDDTLVGLLRSNNTRRQGIEQLYVRFSGRFKRYFMRHGLSGAEAEELAQDMFVKLLRSLDEFRSECPLEAWLWKIARNQLLDHLRKHRDVSGYESDELESLVNNAADQSHHHGRETNELADCVRQRFNAFAKKHPDRAQTLALHVHRDWEIAELASILGRSLGATREYLSQCRKLLRPFLDDCKAFLQA